MFPFDPPSLLQTSLANTAVKLVFEVVFLTSQHQGQIWPHKGDCWPPTLLSEYFTLQNMRGITKKKKNIQAEILHQGSFKVSNQTISKTSKAADALNSSFGNLKEWMEENWFSIMKMCRKTLKNVFYIYIKKCATEKKSELKGFCRKPSQHKVSESKFDQDQNEKCFSKTKTNVLQHQSQLCGNFMNASV